MERLVIWDTISPSQYNVIVMVKQALGGSTLNAKSSYTPTVNQ